jgi:hemerythrin-like metal-binding protein
MSNTSQVPIGKIRKLFLDNKLNTNIPLLEIYHLWLIYLTLALENDLTSQKPEDSHYNFHYISSELINYTLNHFSLEEELFRKFKYPDAIDHINQHILFTNYLKENTVVGKIKNKSVIEETSLFLNNWITEHILEEDVKFIKFCQENKLDINTYNLRILEREIIYLRVNNSQTKLYKMITGKKFDLTTKTIDIVAEVIKFWKTYKLGLGIPIVNMHNLWFAKLVVELDFAISQTDFIKRKTTIDFIFKELNLYFKEHYLVEESLFKLLNYPNRIQHIRKHEEFMESINPFRKTIYEDLNKHRDLVVLLKNWLVAHISFEDKNIKKLFKKNPKPVIEFIKGKIIEKKFIIHPHQLNLYGVVKEILESEAEG